MKTIQETTEEFRLPSPLEEKNIMQIRRMGGLRLNVLRTPSVLLLDSAPVDRL
jgi:hypothetical protein